MKPFFTTLFLALFAFVMGAQNAVTIKDAEALRILDEISSTMSSYESVEMDFALELEFPGMEPEIQSGKIIQAGDKYFLEMQIQSIYSDGKSLWLHMKSNNEVQWNNAEAAAEGGFMNPSSLINLYKTGEFSFAITNEVVEDNQKIQQIEFKSLDDGAPYSKMRLSIVKGKNEVKRMKVFSKDGSKFTLKIESMATNKIYPAEMFVFDKTKYPGVHVEDLRID